MAMGFFTFINFLTLRVNLNVAIIAMINTTYLRQQNAATAGDTVNVSSSQLNSLRLTNQQDLQCITQDNETHIDNDNSVRASNI